MKKPLLLEETGSIALQGQDVPYIVLRSMRRKRSIAFKMERDARLRVLAPVSASTGALTRVLRQRADWILREWNDRKEHPVDQEFKHGSVVRYLGYDCRLSITTGGDRAGHCQLRPHAFIVHIPDNSLSDQALRAEVQLELSLWMKRRARRLLKKRMDLWAARLGVSYNKMLVSSPLQRWGSCSVDDIIRLNWRLLFAPLPVLDYVVAHELCHVVHKNHSARFWACLAKVMPDYKTRRKILRQIERGIMV